MAYLIKRTFRTNQIFTYNILYVQRKGRKWLAEIGRFETPKRAGKYDSGQLFLHKVLGYRGIVLFPWLTRIYDRDAPLKQETNQDDLKFCDSKEPRVQMHTFYQALVDTRDCPHRLTLIDSKEIPIPGLDYVAHEDILPYLSSEKRPFQHPLCYKFFSYCPEKEPQFVCQETLRTWQKKNNPWLELSDVHRETTESVRITVIPFYMGYNDAHSPSVYWWRYCIRIENFGEIAVQLRERHWRIFSLSGTLETVRGRGVVGQEPVLSKNQPAFQYTSHISLQAPSGHMWGTFRMEREDGYTFDCRIPPFSLESKVDTNDPGNNL